MVYSLRENAGMFGSLVYCVGSKSTVWGMDYCAESRPILLTKNTGRFESWSLCFGHVQLCWVIVYSLKENTGGFRSWCTVFGHRLPCCATVYCVGSYSAHSGRIQAGLGRGLP